MKLNKVLLAMAAAVCITSTAQASTGQFTFTGTVEDTPCSIKAGELDQTFDFGTLSQSSLSGGGTSQAETVDIELTGCDTTTKKTARFAFTGPAGHGDTFAASGVNNLGILLSLNQTTISPGSTINHALHNGDNFLRFNAVAMGDPDGTTKPVGTGNFNSVAQFTITYP
ncbi:fimbrial protein [Buttiauxella gaviniae]|uniref:fimbrial protein n=1 Tax=Buttiauxella gaviniae TaxID=82990 RepID=UPI003976F524